MLVRRRGSGIRTEDQPVVSVSLITQEQTSMTSLEIQAVCFALRSPATRTSIPPLIILVRSEKIKGHV